MKSFTLVPRPQSIQEATGRCNCSGPLALPASFSGLADVLRGMFAGVGWPAVELAQTTGLGPEAYRLTIGNAGASIEYTGEAGAFYALVTLGQLARQAESTLPCCHIEDEPALPVRGLMLDISRGRVATLETLLALADKLALLKMNHLELYIEGFSFAYPSYPEVWRDKTPITPAEIQKLDAYCATRHIELVPNQNSLGHMGMWLGDERFRPLAEKPDGFEVFGFKAPPTTMDPTDPGTLALVTTLTDDLLPNFTSQNFNAGLDEPFELGMGKNAEAQRAGGIGQVYLDYVVKMRDMLAQRGKRMLMWGDIVAKHSELIPQLPKDILLLEWGYEAEHPFDTRCKALQQAGLEFCVCPGTSSWSSYAGITDNMLANVRSAAKAAYTYGAKGIILTDWGDDGHAQVLPVSYAALVLSACAAWNKALPTEQALAEGLDLHIFMDKNGTMGRFALELGRFMRHEEFLLPCRTLAAMVAGMGFVDKAQWEMRVGAFVGGLSMFLAPELLAVYGAYYENRKAFDYDGLCAFLAARQAELDGAGMQCADAALVHREFAHTINTLRLLADVHAYIVYGDEWDDERKRAALDAVIALAPTVIDGHKALWNARSKPYGIGQTLTPLQNILSGALERKQILQEV